MLLFGIPQNDGWSEGKNLNIHCGCQDMLTEDTKWRVNWRLSPSAVAWIVSGKDTLKPQPPVPVNATFSGNWVELKWGHTGLGRTLNLPSWRAEDLETHRADTGKQATRKWKQRSKLRCHRPRNTKISSHHPKLEEARKNSHLVASKGAWGTANSLNSDS